MFGTIGAWDGAFEYFVAAHRSPLATHFFLCITALGNVFVITVVALALAGVLWRHRRFNYKAGFALALFGSLAAAEFIKLIVARPRPEQALWLVQTSGYSFPSMHSSSAMVTYGFLAYASWKLMRPSRHRVPCAIFLSVLIALVGASRVYVGVHYFSDVLGGFALGALFLYGGVLVTRRLERAR